MKLSMLCQAAKLRLPSQFAEAEITAIVMDSGLATPGCLYICIKGLHTDGHLYIAEAVSKGAIAILVQEGSRAFVPRGIFRLVAKNTRKTAAILFNAYHGDPCSRLKFIGVTGTNGKTSVTHMLRAILEASFCKCGLIGTVGCESTGRHLENRMHNALANMTTPDPPELYAMLAEMVRDGVEYVLMEVTSHALVLGKLEPIRFEAAIFTNLTPEHLDFHRTMSAYADAKAELFQKSKLSVINVDSPYAERMLSSAVGKRVTCSLDARDANYHAEEIALDLQKGVEYRLCSDAAQVRIKCPVPGEFTVQNSMQAAICTMELGFGVQAIKQALSALSGIKGRMERIKFDAWADIAVLIDYAHTPDALENLLRTARASCRHGERVVLLFGCGGDRDKSKRPLMGAVAERYADAVIVTSDNSRSEDPMQIIAEILSGMKGDRVTVIPDRAEAIRQAILQAHENDLILLAGKGHEEYEINRSGRIPFSERAIALQAFAERSASQRQNEPKDQ